MHPCQHAVWRFNPATTGPTPNGIRLRRKVLWHNDLWCQMPPACPGDRYVHCYTREPLSPLLPRSRWRRSRRRERGRSGLYGHVCVASSVKLPRTSRGHLVSFIPSRKLSRPNGLRLNLVPLGPAPAVAKSHFSTKSTNRLPHVSCYNAEPPLAGFLPLATCRPQGTGCPPHPSSPKMKGFGKVSYRWLIPTS